MLNTNQLRRNTGTYAEVRSGPCAKNFQTNMTIFTRNTNIEMARSDGCHNLMFLTRVRRPCRQVDSSLRQSGRPGGKPHGHGLRTPSSAPVPNSVAVPKVKTYESPAVKPVIVVDQVALPTASNPPPKVTNCLPIPATATLPCGGQPTSRVLCTRILTPGCCVNARLW